MSRRAAGLPEGEAKVRAVDDMFDAIAPRYDTLNRILTMRMDVGWRKRTVRSLDLGPGAVVLDLACGTGDLCRVLDDAGYRPVGIDRSAGMLAAARTSAPLVRGDALALPVADGSVDGIVCGFALRNVLGLDLFFAECARVLRPGGRVALLEVAVPDNRVLRAGHRVYFGKVVPFVGGLLSDRAAYRYLPQSVAYLPPVPEVLGMMSAAGFADAARRALSGGIAQLLTGTRGPATIPRNYTQEGATARGDRQPGPTAATTPATTPRNYTQEGATARGDRQPGSTAATTPATTPRNYTQEGATARGDRQPGSTAATTPATTPRNYTQEGATARGDRQPGSTAATTPATTPRNYTQEGATARGDRQPGPTATPPAGGGG